MHLNMYARDEGEKARHSAAEQGWKQGHGSQGLSACGSCIQIWVPVTKEKKRSAALQSMVGSRVMVLMFYQPVVHAFKYVCP
jgi:hypothetical protein